MGSRFVKPRISRLYLRIPKVDWPSVTQGRKTELRANGRGTPHTELRTPTPIVAYAVGVAGPRFKLMVVEDVWEEPVGAISDESLAREGFKTRREFRAYWRKRNHTHEWRPLTVTRVFRVRPFTSEDRAPLADALFDRLYGEYVDA